MLGLPKAPFDPAQEARIHDLARLIAMQVVEELASRGAFADLPVGDVLDAMFARDLGQAAIARFPHRDTIR